MADDVLMVARLVVAIPLATAAVGRIARPDRLADVTMRALTVAELLVAIGLLWGESAWVAAVSAHACLLVPVVSWLMRPGADVGALAAVLRAVGLAVPAAFVVWEGRGGAAGPDVTAWLSGLGAVQLAAIVVGAAILFLMSSGLRPEGILPLSTPSARPRRAEPPPEPHRDATAPHIGAASAGAARAIVAPADVTPAALGDAKAGDATPGDATPAAPGDATPAAPGDAAHIGIAAAALIRPGPELTIGMATYDDFDGVYFTIQALRLYHDLENTELVVVDNYGCSLTENFVRHWARGRYILAKEVVGTAAPKDLVFREANGAAVLCCDSHVLFAPGAIARLKRFYREHPDCADLLQGPLVYDDGELMSTHFDPIWREQMWGVWATDERGFDRDGEPFEVPMQGLGVFSCRREAWLGFHPGFRGFGGEEGYLHVKFRQAGRRCLCLPWLRWMHRFGRPHGIPYPLTVEDKLRNYLLGHAELGLDPAPVLVHFSQYLPPERISQILASTA